ncbi:MAG: class I SAM-dependent methyltransferase [Armatimonadota bacterium]
MHRGWGKWSPLAEELPHLPNAWGHCPAEQQVDDRPDDYLPELDLVLEWLQRCGPPILDLACGTGRLSLALAERGYPVVGLDLNAEFIRRAREEAARRGPAVSARLRFEVADARRFRVPERFGLVIMMDQSFKYLLTHDDHLDCLQSVREHLRDDGRFLVEHRCLLKLPDAGQGEPYTTTQRGEEWIGLDTYDPVRQVGVSVFQPLDRPEAPPEIEPCRDFTYPELSLLHRVVGFAEDAVLHDLDERPPTTAYFDCALVLRKAEPWGRG